MQGEPFGRYRLVELLGRGGMGEVWKAYDTSTDRVVAVKLLREDLADDEQFQQRFRREARAAAALTEPHVVPIHNFGDIDGRLYVDMRLIHGHDLDTMLRDGPLDPQRAVGITAQVASALNAAHQTGLVHRDVKPSNILVADKDFAYLIDFGIARTAADKGLTNTGTTVGTWAYMAPERFTSGEVDARSDVYALACVLHQALTGEKPFRGPSMQQQLTGHLLTPPPRPSAVRSSVPVALDDVIAKGMAKEPGDRFASTMDLARAATAAVAKPVVPHRVAPPPRPVPVPRPPRPAPRPQPRPVAPPPPPPRAAFVTPPPTPRPSPPPAQPRWRRPVTLVSAVAVLVVVAVVIAVAVSGGDEPPIPAAEPTSTSTTTTTTAPAPVNMDTLLLDVPEMNSLLGTTALAVAKEGRGLLDDESTIAPPECTAVTLIARKAEYANTAVTDSRWRTLSQTAPLQSVIENVVQVATPEAATSYVDTQARFWEGCQNKQVVSTNIATKAVVTYDFLDVVRSPDMVVVRSTVGPVRCVRTLAVRGAYLADVSVCSESVTNQSELVATNILNRTAAG